MQGMHSRVLLARKQLSTVHDCAVSHSEAGSSVASFQGGHFHVSSLPICGGFNQETGICLKKEAWSM